MDDADVVAQEEEELQRHTHHHQDMDALMADAIAQQEQAEVDALVSALEGQGGQFSDDEDYDGLFMDLIQQQQPPQQGGQGMNDEQDVEMS